LFEYYGFAHSTRADDADKVSTHLRLDPAEKLSSPGKVFTILPCPLVEFKNFRDIHFACAPAILTLCSFLILRLSAFCQITLQSDRLFVKLFDKKQTKNHLAGINAIGANKPDNLLSIFSFISFSTIPIPMLMYQAQHKHSRESITKTGND
jgi:hypothetical protein